jgi:hypothetical protein
MSIEQEFWKRGELSYKLHGPQLHIYTIIKNSKDSPVVILCSRRFGKSFLAALIAQETAIQHPNSKTLIVAPTKSSAYEIYTPIFHTISADAPEGLVRPAKSAGKWYVGDSEIVFSGFDTVANDLRGRGTVLIIIDEAGFTLPDSFDYISKSVLLPMNQKTIGKEKGKMIYISTPAQIPDHPFNIMWEQYEEMGKLHKFTIYDNPILTEADIQDIIREQGGRDSIGFRREYLCQNVRDAGSMIIPKFSSENILDANKGIDIVGDSWIVTDFGGMRDKTVVQVLGRRVSDGRPVIYKEVIHDVNTDTVMIGNSIKSLQTQYSVKPYHIWVDAQGQTLVDLYKMCGITPNLPPKVDKDGAIASLNAAFYNQEIYVSSECEFTIGSLLNCTFNQNRTDFMRTSKYGHADAIMTAVYGYRVASMVEVSKSLNKINPFRQGDDKRELSRAMMPERISWNPKT